MIIERYITVEGQIHKVVISDEQEALLAASAAGSAVVGLWDRTMEQQNLSPAVYLVEQPEDADDSYLEQVVRRTLGLPWLIGETEHLVIREFCMGDIPHVPREDTDTEADRIFYTPSALQDYIKNQYGFYQYGIWALIEKESGTLVGKAGVNQADAEEDSSLELGYHIFEPFRRKGYAREACQEIQRYVQQTWGCKLFVRIDAANEGSVRLARSLGLDIGTKGVRGLG